MFDPAQEERTWEDIKESCGILDKQTIYAIGQRNKKFLYKHILGLNTNSPVTKKAIEMRQNSEKFKETGDDSDATKVAIMAPRGHSKSMSWTIAKSIDIALYEKGKSIIVSSASQTQSTDLLEKIKRIIMRNEALKHLNPTPENMAELGDKADIADSEGSWAAQAITTTTDVTIKTMTFGSSIRSQHVDYVFLDDVMQDEGQGTRSTKQEKDTFYNVIAPIIENKGGVLQLVGTPMSHDDLLMELMDKDNYYSKSYQAYDEDTEEPLWPDNWTYEALMEKKHEVGPARFAREYMCNPMSVEEQFFSEQECIRPNIDDTHYKSNVYTDEYMDWAYHVGVDIAMSDKAGADYTVFTVIGDPSDSEQRHVVDVIRKKGMSPRTIADKLEQLDSKYGFASGLVEKNSIGEGVKKEILLRDKLMGRIDFFDTTRSTRPEILSSLQAALHRGELTLPSSENRVGSTLLSELSAFHMNSRGKLEGKGHDDTVMSLAIAYHAVSDLAGVSSATIIGSGDEVEDDSEDEAGSERGAVSDKDAGSQGNDIQIGIV